MPNDVAVTSDMIPLQPGVAAKGLLPRFYAKPKTISRPVIDPEKRRQMLDAETGEPVWRADEIVEDWVEITIIGDKQSVVCKKCTPAVIEQFPDHYRAWKAGASGIIGTPIEHLPGLDERVLHEFKAANIYTIEGLAGLSDLQISRVGIGGRHLVLRAQNFIAERAGPGLEAQVRELSAERDQMRGQIEVLSGQVGELLAFLRKQHSQDEVEGTGGVGGYARPSSETRDDIAREGAEP